MEGEENVTVIDVYSEFSGKIRLRAVKTNVDILRIDALSFSSKVKLLELVHDSNPVGGFRPSKGICSPVCNPAEEP